MDELIKSIPTVLKAVGYSTEVAEAAAIAAWKHAAGEGLRNHAVAIKLDENTLVVAVRDAIWQKQLATMKGQLLFRVNSILGQPLLNNIELRIDPKVVIIAQPEKVEAAEMLDNEVPMELWSAACAIRDKDLRQKFLKAAVGALKKGGRQ
ncbi:MAG TPA: DciA family protein [Pyrinomonadaceae bacterium]|nr:DciA family protein [Pyrinomonadaceae bacterium]